MFSRNRKLNHRHPSETTRVQVETHFGGGSLAPGREPELELEVLMLMPLRQKEYREILKLRSQETTVTSHDLTQVAVVTQKNEDSITMPIDTPVGIQNTPVIGSLHEKEATESHHPPILEDPVKISHQLDDGDLWQTNISKKTKRALKQGELW